MSWKVHFFAVIVLFIINEALLFGYSLSNVDQLYAIFSSVIRTKQSRTSRTELFCKKSALQNYAKKHLCQSLLFNKVVSSACNSVKKETLAHMFSYGLWEFFKNPFFIDLFYRPFFYRPFYRPSVQNLFQQKLSILQKHGSIRGKWYKAFCTENLSRKKSSLV